jgi:hypothetical protein
MNRAPKFEGEDPVKLHNLWILTTNERSVSLSFDKDSDIPEYLKAEWTNVNYSTTIQLHDEKIMIQKVTDGLSAKQYIAKYLPKGSK